MELKPEENYKLVSSTWITAKNMSIYIHFTDEGVVCDIYKHMKELNEPITSTYAFFAEAEED